MKNIVYARYITTLSKCILFSFVLISRYKLFNCNGSYFYISYFLSIYVLTHVCKARSGITPLFLTIPWIMYTFFFCFKCQHGAISGNGRYCSKLHPPLSSSQSTRIVPSNRNMSHFTTPSHRHDMRGFPAFPPPYFVLNPVPP